MRSYFEHLETLIPKKSTLPSRPVFRSSAIFPVLRLQGICTRVLFLGYWLLKRKIDKIEAIITLRALNGAPLARKFLPIMEARAYNVELNELLQLGEITEEDFYGSLEIEFYAAHNLVFPYPAVAVNFYGEAFSSIVHVAQRVYNDYEDMRVNSQTAVPESGFNIYVDDQHHPFLSLINGAVPQENAKIEYEFFNRAGQQYKYVQELGTLAPYQTSFLFPAEKVDLRSFLGGQVGTCKAHFHVNWIFPRLLVGNIQKSPNALSITHTYYDCSEAKTQKDYWPEAEVEWHPASLMIPLWLNEDHFTNVYFYPIYSPSHFAIDVEIFDHEGKLVFAKEKQLYINSPSEKFACLNFKELLKEWGIESFQNYAARIIAKPIEGSLLPSRIKLGLDHGHVGKGLPCNICTNLQPFNPSLEAKPSSFKWLPLLADRENCAVWLMNSSQRKMCTKEASMELTFFRESDCEQLKRSLKLPPNGFLIIDPKSDDELSRFLQGRIGWLTVVTDNSSLTTYYYADHDSCCVGGDHGF